VIFWDTKNGEVRVVVYFSNIFLNNSQLNNSFKISFKLIFSIEFSII